MELLERQTLRHAINGKPLDIEAVLDLGIQICRCTGRGTPEGYRPS
jgi:hypothetical protein